MAGVYLDTSALGRVLLGEPDAAAVLNALEGFDQHVASRLVGVELRRLALRFELLEQASQLLAGVALVPIDEPLLEQAETVPPATVGTLDAIHLVTALSLAEAGFVEAVMTYDARLAEGARRHGLTVVSPG
ncbi:MAG: type II toxin-antitoxin system VapC family toxin [Actinobacteria bacterium]|nr:type II toxin-antitoxin system VapC family toxin [Actinomycetota bacterium]